MFEPATCPICGSEEVDPVMQTAPAKEPSENNSILGLLAYRCANSHRFVVGILQSSKSQARSEGVRG